METKNEFTLFGKEEVERRFTEILSKAKSARGHQKIAKIIHDGFYNQLFVTLPINQSIANFKLYRVTLPYYGLEENNPFAFSHPPKRLAKRNRANVSGHPVFYAATSEGGAFVEMKDMIKKELFCYISEWELDANSKGLAHPLVINKRTLEASSLYNNFQKSMLDQTVALFPNIPSDAKEGLMTYMTRVGDLFSLPGEEYYKITSSYAHHVLYDMRKKGAPVNIIIYPSVSGKEFLNFAVHPSVVSNGNLKLTKVFKVQIKDIRDGGFSVSSDKFGTNKDGNISWERRKLSLDSIDFSRLELFTCDKQSFAGEGVLSKEILGMGMTVQDLVNEEVNKFFEGGIRDALPKESLFSLKSERIFREDVLHVEYGHGLHINTNLGESCIELLSIPIKWQSFFEPA